ncbi:DUF2975 domain-containing protein [Erythrobacter crassostreae]|uniref:DUF2975 domain-containing protein n=1 Tax=Erythrobacter crassostreae TaxID=2828328 RepID=A0A9X1F7Q0_9SPHN|nr:DUF2975 domain-containing protein [Erythrobacter crassostrea]MBV7260315.1 DUF2975 domain-containing protein [Erythrobacter crassostrea]
MSQAENQNLFRLTAAVVKASVALFSVLAVAALLVLGLAIVNSQSVLQFIFSDLGSAADVTSPVALPLYLTSLFAQLAVTAIALRILSNLVTAIRENGPFTSQNITRLKRLGWFAIAISILGMLVSVTKANLFEGLPDMTAPPYQFDIAGPVLALTFFVIAQAFSVGLANRQELGEFV